MIKNENIEEQKKNQLEEGKNPFITKSVFFLFCIYNYL